MPLCCAPNTAAMSSRSTASTRCKVAVAIRVAHDAPAQAPEETAGEQDGDGLPGVEDLLGRHRCQPGRDGCQHHYHAHGLVHDHCGERGMASFDGTDYRSQ